MRRFFASQSKIKTLAKKPTSLKEFAGYVESKNAISESVQVRFAAINICSDPCEDSDRVLFCPFHFLLFADLSCLLGIRNWLLRRTQWTRFTSSLFRLKQTEQSRECEIGWRA